MDKDFYDDLENFYGFGELRCWIDFDEFCPDCMQPIDPDQWRCHDCPLRNGDCVY